MIAVHVLHALVDSSDLGPGVSYFETFQPTVRKFSQTCHS